MKTRISLTLAGLGLVRALAKVGSIIRIENVPQTQDNIPTSLSTSPGSLSQKKVNQGDDFKAQDGAYQTQRSPSIDTMESTKHKSDRKNSLKDQRVKRKVSFEHPSLSSHGSSNSDTAEQHDATDEVSKKFNQQNRVDINNLLYY